MYDLVTHPKEAVQAILSVRGWSQNRLAQESGASQSLISRVLDGKQKGLNGRSIKKLRPFLTLPPGQGLPCDPASSREPGQGEGDAA